MAGNSLGQLLVKLGLDAAEFVQGLTKAEYQSRRFSQSLERGITSAVKDVAAALGTLKIADVFYENTKAIIEQAAGLNDLSDITGASVEELSRLSNQAAIAGTDFNTLQGFVSKLAVSMTKVDDESKDAARAMQFLGVTTKDPARAFQEIAVKLSQYEDGIGKVALATALWGKQGAQVLPLLKDIADLQDVGATVTKKQADEAEALQKNFARLGVESRAFGNTILNDLVPALNTLIERFNLGVKASGSFGQGLEALFSVNVRPGAIADQLGEVDAAISRITEHQKGGGFNPLSAFNEETLNSLRAQREIILKARQQRASLNAVYSPDDTNVRDQILGRKPEAAFSGSNGNDKAAAKERISDAERYIQSLRDQVEKTLDLTAAEQVLREVQDGRLEKATRAQIDQALAYAQEIDAAREAEKWIKELEKRYDEEGKAIEKANQDRVKRVESLLDEADQIARANEDLRDEIAIIVGGEGVRDALERQRVDNAIAIKEEALAMAQLDPLRQSEVETIRIQIDLLRERAGLLGGRSFAKQLAEEARSLQDVKNMFSDTFADAFTDFATGAKSAKEAFADFANDIARQIARIAAQNLANAIFGGNNSAGPDIFGVLAKILSSGSAGGTPGIIPGDIPAFASGGMPSSGFAVVGERGPEIVRFRGGERVYSHGESRGMVGGQTINQEINVTVPNTSSRPSVQQMTRRALEQLRSGARRL